MKLFVNSCFIFSCLMVYSDHTFAKHNDWYCKDILYRKYSKLGLDQDLAAEVCKNHEGPNGFSKNIYRPRLSRQEEFVKCVDAGQISERVLRVQECSAGARARLKAAKAVRDAKIAESNRLKLEEKNRQIETGYWEAVAEAEPDFEDDAAASAPTQQPPPQERAPAHHAAELGSEEN